MLSEKGEARCEVPRTYVPGQRYATILNCAAFISDFVSEGNVVVVMRKLLPQLYAVARRRTPWIPKSVPSMSP